MEIIDYYLNKFTMYRLTLYYLIFLVGASVVLSFFGLLSFNPLDIVINSFLAVAVSYIANYLFAKLFGAVTNVESVFITALILVLIIPAGFSFSAAFIISASVVAMASKYLLTVEKRHIFNPAAVSIAGISLLVPSYAATWWVGTPPMLPFVLVGGILLLRKMQRENLVFSFLVVYLLIAAAGSFLSTPSLFSVINGWKLSVFYSALFFFMFVMLTEPLTSPATNKLRRYYGYFVAVLYATPHFGLLGIALRPEIALCLGNVFSYIMSPGYRFALPLLWKKQVSPDTFVFAFNKNPDLKFTPGQYMEWTLNHKNADSRGNRRYFSISSSPTEKEIMTTVKFYNPSSSYKKQLLNLPPGRQIIASQVAGDFVLPQNLGLPLVFIAGGVGIAPFRSMVQYILDKKLYVNIVLLYSNKSEKDILFPDIFEKAKQFGLKTIYILTDVSLVRPDWHGKTGHIDEDTIRREIPDFANRIFYLSGPQLMVQRFARTLLGMGIDRGKIISDFFPGYSET